MSKHIDYVTCGYCKREIWQPSYGDHMSGHESERVRVREAIEKLKEKFHKEEGGKCRKWDALDELQDELGLVGEAKR